MKFHLYQPLAIHELGGRQNQEDAIYPLMGEASEDNRVFVVCDGMGGLDKGEVASDAVSRALGHMADVIRDAVPVFTDEDFRQCLSKSYDALDLADVDNQAQMGTTMTFLCFHDGGCMVAHIGDSRIYHIRPSLGNLRGILFRSRDHSLVQQLYEQGEISLEEMRTSPKKNIILKAMQPHQPERTEATIVHIDDVEAGDFFYLCTDGMLEQMDDAALMAIFADESTTDDQKRQQLIDATSDNADNHSAYLIHVKDVLDDVEDKKEPVPESKLAPVRQKNHAVAMIYISIIVIVLLAVVVALFLN